MEFSKNQKSFSQIFFAFFRSILNFKHLATKDALIADVVPEILAPKNMVR